MMTDNKDGMKVKSSSQTDGSNGQNNSEKSCSATNIEMKETYCSKLEHDSQATIQAEPSSPAPSIEEDVGLQLARTMSINPAPIPIPRSQRRGLFSSFPLIPEVENPKHYSRPTKWFITFVVAIAAASAPMGSSIFFPSLGQVTETFKTTDTVTNLSVALYMLSMGIFPLWWASFSERLGRRTVFISSFALFAVANVLSAVSTSIEMLIVTRMLGGGAAASAQSVGAGSIADIWDPVERGRAMGIFYLGPLCGPLVAPIIGGILSQVWDWRSTQWFLTIYGGLTLLLLIFGLPETLTRTDLPSLEQNGEPLQRPISRVSSRQMINTTTKVMKIIAVAIVEPLKSLWYLRFPAVIWTIFYASLAFGSLYILNVSIQTTFSKPPYNFSTISVGLMYVPNSLGYITSSFFGGRWMDSVMKREAKRANRKDERGKFIYQPEDRMCENAWFGALIFPAGLIWYGWTAEKGVFWLCPAIANFFFGLGSMIIFSMGTTMLTEFMPKRASIGVALNALCRNIVSCIGGVVAAPVIHAIGNGWLFTIVGVSSLLGSAVIWAMKHYGPRWRITMEQKMK
ncbi:hypothetical protein FQN57_006429 [Myotisia sp. PD_48]|nr:hypothetical protein FQN57_006429 [Myotisia sp. PD_48]